MTLRIIVYCCMLYTVHGLKKDPPHPDGGPGPGPVPTPPPAPPPPPAVPDQSDVPNRRCLTGYMTDVQNWVHFNGTLTKSVDQELAIDLSYRADALPTLIQQLAGREQGSHVKYLSLASSGLPEIPAIFGRRGNGGRPLEDTLEYVSFYGNNFAPPPTMGQPYDVVINATRAREMIADLMTQRKPRIWSSGFNGVTFTRLRELDLRACSIEVLETRVFVRMKTMESLYLGENAIYYIDALAFVGLNSLLHLDLSRNYAYDENNLQRALVLETMDLFQDMINLQSLDLSFTLFTQRNSLALRSLSKKIQRLSLCYSLLTTLRDDTFKHTSLKYLDLSGNFEVLARSKALRGLEKSLLVLYAEDAGLKTMEPFKNFKNLEILKLTSNEINSIPRHIAETLTNLQVLDLDKNRLTTWLNRHVSLMPKLRFLSLRHNNINMITDEMANDLVNISYVGLSENFIICNCNARDLYELGWRNEFLISERIIKNINNDSSTDPKLSFHIGFQEYNKLIENRKPVIRDCEGADVCDASLVLQFHGDLLFFDYNPKDYQCLLMSEEKSTGFQNFPTCNQKNSNASMEIVKNTRNKLLFIIIPATLLPALACLFLMRRNLWYFLITMRNSAMLSLINKKDTEDETTIFNYDVFVSYCNEDRAWVLDELLPHVERDCSISVCLHERDFQVGLTILENIVSCMDRSRSIMLILSQRFLLSQWCQFEMHLAQHRLLETRREDLILILLEDIPRRLRPNTLHYLMLTKTYIVWPRQEAERGHFWRRLKRSLVTHKNKESENVSLA